MIYKNTGPSVKTFYGVTFASGEIKEVSGIIDHHKFIQVDSLPKEPPVVNDIPIDPAKVIRNRGRPPKIIPEQEVVLDTPDIDSGKVNEDISNENNEQEEI